MIHGPNMRRAVSGHGGVERSLVEGSGLRWRGAIVGGGERLQMEGIDRRVRSGLRRRVSGGGE